MEWCVPLQKFETAKVHIGSLLEGPKPLVPLSYLDGQVQFPTLSILLPHATVKVFDSKTGRLDISLRDTAQAAQKIQALQSSILAAVSAKQETWFRVQYDELHKLFQPMIENDILHLYCPISNDKRGFSETISVFSTEGGKVHHTTGVRENHIKPGDSIRVAVRIQGISFHSHPAYGQWTGKFRLQHRIISIYVNESL